MTKWLEGVGDEQLRIFANDQTCVFCAAENANTAEAVELQVNILQLNILVNEAKNSVADPRGKRVNFFGGTGPAYRNCFQAGPGLKIQPMHLYCLYICTK